MCGICVLRCPTKAIFFNKSTVFVNHTMENHFHRVVSVTDENNADKTFSIFETIKTHGYMISESYSIFDLIYAKIEKILKSPNQQQFPNLLARNLLNVLGIKTLMRRRGEVYSRMDLVFENQIYHGVVEVEFVPEVMLDAPRDILDDLAVMISRTKLKKDAIIPVILGLSLPNKRSEYWQVITDINNVLGVHIHTMTIGALILLVWNFCKLSYSPSSFPYSGSDSCSIRKDIVKLLGRTVKIETGMGDNILEPSK